MSTSTPPFTEAQTAILQKRLEAYQDAESNGERALIRAETWEELFPNLGTTDIKACIARHTVRIQLYHLNNILACASLNAFVQQMVTWYANRRHGNDDDDDPHAAESWKRKKNKSWTSYWADEHEKEVHAKKEELKQERLDEGGQVTSKDEIGFWKRAVKVLTDALPEDDKKAVTARFEKWRQTPPTIEEQAE